MSRPFCSIVMATYNKAPLLELSLRSIREQRVPFEYEVIVVDDGSRDDTPQVCKKYGVQYAYLNRPYYANGAKPRNIALKLAHSDILIQQCEVIHDTPNTIEFLASKATKGFIDFAAVYNAELDLKGEPTPKAAPFTNVRANVVLTGPHNPRPFFFLGVAMREDIFAIGGNDEEFVKSGYDDNWLADCLIKGRGCQARHWGNVLGWHIEHWRPETVAQDQNEMRLLYEAKVRAGVYCASGGAWSLVPLADVPNMRT